MHKKISIVLCAILLIIAFISIIIVFREKEKGNKNFNGTIVTIDRNEIIVEPFKNEEVYKIGDRICVKTNGGILPQESLEKLKTGDKVRVGYKEIDSSSKMPEIDIAYHITLLSEIEENSKL